jgi:hypothetical protein
MQLQRACLFACFAALTALAAGHAGDSSMPTFVPWKVLNPGDETLKTDLVLYWIPSSRDEIRRSPMLTSRPLAIYSTQCVGMQLIRPDDSDTIEHLGASGRLPTAILATREGVILERVENDGGLLRAVDVEKRVRDTIVAREAEADRLLDEAAAKLAAGDRDGAVALYRRVCDQRCLLPREARHAQRALHRLDAEEH